MEPFAQEPVVQLVRSDNQSFRFTLSEAQERLFRLGYELLALVNVPLSIGCTIFIDSRACFSSTKLAKRSVYKKYAVLYVNKDGALSIEKRFGYQLRYLQPCWVTEHHFKLYSTYFQAILYLHGAKLQVRQSLQKVIMKQVAKIVYGS